MYLLFYDEETGITEKVSAENFAESAEDEEFEFFNDNIRYVWHKHKEEYYFSVVDVIQVLTDSADGRKYWSVLKTRLIQEGSELTTNCSQLKMPSHKDGKMYKTDVATMKQLLRIIQSIPSPKAEPIKQWLAQVGSDRLDEMTDPELAIQRAMDYYRRKGYSDKWIAQRLRTIEVRNELTDEWKRSGVHPGKEFAILTTIITKEWSGMKPAEYKAFKGLRKENLRDNMTNTELTLNMLAEVSATELSREYNPDGFDASSSIARAGGEIAGNARKELEKALGRSVISPQNAEDFKRLK